MCPADDATTGPSGDAHRELQARVRQGELIGEFSRLALSGLGFDALLEAASRIAAEGLGTPLARVLQYMPDEGALLVRAGVGWKPGVVGHARLGADMASPAGYALKTGASVISNHLADEQRFRTPALIAEHGARRALNVVVRGQREPFGVLEADSRDPGRFSERDLAFIEALAGVLGLAADREADAAEREALLRDKDLLMAEVHHRVRNSLFLVQGLLRQQIRAAALPEVREELDQASRRGSSIAAVHRQLHSGGSLDRIPAGEYLGSLVREMAASSPDRSIRLDAPTDLAWSADRATACGLVVTELVINALKYGRGAVAVRVEPGPDEADSIAVEDEGPGPPAGFDPSTSNGLGMRILRALLRGGGLELDRSVAGRVRFVARLPAAAAAAG
ncbi:MAG: GAF domain-containing protein, partial [Acetobacteraceae bacterium]|nr:GAF domain-containing protein [Acetobacteraceae bacterium]